MIKLAPNVRGSDLGTAPPSLTPETGRFPTDSQTPNGHTTQLTLGGGLVVRWFLLYLPQRGSIPHPSRQSKPATNAT